MKKLTVNVCGDPTVDWISVRNNKIIDRGPYYWQAPTIPPINLSSQPGGSALLTMLLKQMLAGEKAELYGSDVSEKLLKEPINNYITDSWTVWQAYKNKGSDHNAFRLSEWREYEPGNYDFSKEHYKGNSDLLIIEDSGLGFSAEENHEYWPETIKNKAGEKPEHIIVKFAKYSSGKPSAILQKIIKSGLGEITTIVTSISDLRSCAEKISTSLSWEKIFEETAGAVLGKSCPFIDEKTGKLAFYQVIVSIGSSGAVIINKDRCTLIFDRTGQEGDFEHTYPGQMMGYNTCMIGAMTSCWIANKNNPEWHKTVLKKLGVTLEKADYKKLLDDYLWIYSVKEGLGLARFLHFYGYESFLGADKINYLQFPFKVISDTFKTRNEIEGEQGAKDIVKTPKRIWDLGYFIDKNKRIFSESNFGKWTILEDTLAINEIGEDSNSKKATAVFEMACSIVKKGPDKVLPNVPLESVQIWRSADRFEIEGVRSVNNAIRDYMKLQRPDKPLSVVVFGPPGSGKSFAIKEIAKNLEIDKDAQITFNLSQFESPDELPQAFHQIRDIHLKGKLPLVFWDEFDTPCQGRKLGWLRYFLAPMQDGAFAEKGITHPIGGGIYVFAGGTSQSFEEFCNTRGEDEIMAKKPDFISRLRAFINVKGPNGSPNTVEDKLFMIRRAFLLNNFLEFGYKNLVKKDMVNIDDGVINAFLKTTRYRHGARSLVNIIDMSALGGRSKFELSNIPPNHLLKMHVDANEFMSLTRLGHRDMLRIGITGHIGLDPSRMNELGTGIENAIKLIEKHFENRNLTVFSPLAEGADRVVARALLTREGSKLIAVLPFEKEDYITDFGKSDAHHRDRDNPAMKDETYNGAELRQEFNYWLSEKAIETITMPPASTRNEAYQNAGYYIAEHSDVIIAVWDGKGAQGQGGTAEIVYRAIELNKPVCHIWAGNHKKDEKKRTSAGDKHGRMRHTNFSKKSKGEWEGECVE
ncbi:MAG: hypothetical protein ACD_47C00058G0002 [uncultured bacterium]|nr:MAG: hypothetical protein ACD_47C00058G0002 [uncultured bacterium]